MSDSLTALKDVVAQYEFSLKVRRALADVQRISETDEETFERVMELAQKNVCANCRDYCRTGASELCPTRSVRLSDPTRP